MPKADRIYFHHFDPRSTEGGLLADREDLREELLRRLEGFVTQPRDTKPGAVVLIIGDKGVGKSILTYAVLRELREKHSGSVLTVSVDCRRHRSWREVLAALAEGLRDELLGLAGAKLPVPDYAISAAGLLRDYAHRDAVTLTSLQTLTTTFARTSKRSGALKLHQAAVAEVSATLTSAETNEAKQETKVQLDDWRLTRLLTALLTDLEGDADAPWRVAVFIDNLDELHYDAYHPAAERSTTRQEVEGVLGLRDAPIALVLNARTYFSGPFARALHRPTKVAALPAQELLLALERRIRDEPPATQTFFARPEVREELAWLAGLPGMTPLAFLTTVYDRADTGTLNKPERESGTWQVLLDYYGLYGQDRLRRLVSCFRNRTQVSREELQAALQDAHLLDIAQRDQLLLPVDFWDPRELTLDPSLLPLLALVS